MYNNDKVIITRAAIELSNGFGTISYPGCKSTSTAICILTHNIDTYVKYTECKNGYLEVRTAGSITGPVTIVIIINL